MTRALTLIFAMTACSGSPVVQQDQQPIIEEPTTEPAPGDDAVSEQAVKITVDYVSTVCAFHAQPSCVQSRAETLVVTDEAPGVCADLRVRADHRRRQPERRPLPRIGLGVDLSHGSRHGPPVQRVEVDPWPRHVDDLSLIHI